MPYANNHGVHIYYEVEGQGPPLVLAHAFRRNLDRWRQIGFVDALKNDYMLILFDARGHGKSGKPHDPGAYGINMVNDVVTVLDELRINKTNYFGYSMGAGVGFKAALNYPDRFTSFILGGFSPCRTEVLDNVPPIREPEQIRRLPSDPEAFLRLVERQLGRPLTNDERKIELANDLEALSAATVTFKDFMTLNNQKICSISVPFLLYAGDTDPAYAGAKEASRNIPGAKFFSLPGLNHAQAGPSLLVLPHVKEFLSHASKA